MKVRDLKKTCTACPSQWEGRTDENRPVYVRYRYGRLSVRVGPPDGDMDSAVGGIEVLGRQVGDGWDGTIRWRQVKKMIRSVDVASALAEAEG